MLYLAAAAGGRGLPAAQHRPTPSAELDYFIGDAEPRWSSAIPARREAIEPIARERAARPSRRSTPEAAAASPSARRGQADGIRRCRARAPTISPRLLYTSGTTGRSKGAMLTHGQPRLQRRGADRLLALHGRRRAAPCAADLPHPRPVRRDQRHAARRGASMIFLPKFDADEIFELMPRATVADGRADLLRAPAAAAGTERRDDARICGCSSPARRRSSPRPTGNGRRAPATPSSNATA